MKRQMILAAVCAALSVGPTARAGEGPMEAATADRDTARQRALFVRGNKLFDERNWQEAEAAYLEAWSIKKSYDLAGNLGNVELKLGKPKEAAEHLSYALREFPVGGKAERRQALMRFFDEARQQVGVVRVVVSKPGAEVLVDGKPIGYGPLAQDVFVNPGAHGIEARLEGYETAHAAVEAAKGAQHAVTLEMRRLAAAIEAPAPQAERGVAPAQRTEGAPIEERSLVPAIVLGGVAVVGLGVGLGLLVAARGEGTAAEELHSSILGDGQSCVGGAGNFDPRCADLEDASMSADSLQNAGVGVMVGAGFAAAAAGAYLLLWPEAPRPPQRGLRVRVLPAVGTLGRGVIVQGAF